MRSVLEVVAEVDLAEDRLLDLEILRITKLVDLCIVKIIYKLKE